jgi:outer membrane protein
MNGLTKTERVTETLSSSIRIRKGLIAILVALIILIAVTRPVSAQQITRVAVVDLTRILAAFPKNASAIRNFETKKAEVQVIVDAKAAEIRQMQAKKNEYDPVDNQEEIATLNALIAQKSIELKEYAQARQNELDLIAKALSSNVSFLQKLNATIAHVAESEGFSLVLNLRPQDQASAIVLWNSPSVDITDKVIQALGSER